MKKFISRTISLGLVVSLCFDPHASLAFSSSIPTTPSPSADSLFCGQALANQTTGVLEPISSRAKFIFDVWVGGAARRLSESPVAVWGGGTGQSEAAYKISHPLLFVREGHKLQNTSRRRTFGRYAGTAAIVLTSLVSAIPLSVMSGYQIYRAFSRFSDWKQAPLSRKLIEFAIAVLLVAPMIAWHNLWNKIFPGLRLTMDENRSRHQKMIDWMREAATALGDKGNTLDLLNPLDRATAKQYSGWLGQLDGILLRAMTGRRIIDDWKTSEGIQVLDFEAAQRLRLRILVERQRIEIMEDAVFSELGNATATGKAMVAWCNRLGRILEERPAVPINHSDLLEVESQLKRISSRYRDLRRLHLRPEQVLGPVELRPSILPSDALEEDKLAEALLVRLRNLSDLELTTLWDTVETSSNRAIREIDSKVDQHGQGLVMWAQRKQDMNRLLDEIQNIHETNPLRSVLEARWERLRDRIQQGGRRSMTGARGWQNDLDALRLDLRLLLEQRERGMEEETPFLPHLPAPAHTDPAAVSAELAEGTLAKSSAPLLSRLFDAFDVLGAPLAESMLASYVFNPFEMASYTKLPDACSLISHNLSAISIQEAGRNWNLGNLWNDLQGWTALSDEERREQWRALEAEREKNGSPIDRNRRDEFNAFVFFWLDNQTPVYEKAHWWSILSAAEVYLTFGADAAETETLMNDTRKSKAAMSDWLTDFGFPPLGDPEREAKDIAALFAGDDINVWELTPSAIPKRRLNLVRQGEKAAADLERQRAGLISQAEGLGLTVLADEARTASADVLQRIGQDIFHELDYRRKLKELASLTQDRARQTRTDEVEKVNHAWDIAGERAAAKTLERH